MILTSWPYIAKLKHHKHLKDSCWCVRTLMRRSQKTKRTNFLKRGREWHRSCRPFPVTSRAVAVCFYLCAWCVCVETVLRTVSSLKTWHLEPNMIKQGWSMKAVRIQGGFSVWTAMLIFQSTLTSGLWPAFNFSVCVFARVCVCVLVGVCLLVVFRARQSGHTKCSDGCAQQN